MRTFAVVFAVAFLAFSASSLVPTGAGATTTEIGAQAKAKKVAKPRDCNRGLGMTGWKGREARRFCRMGQG